MCISPSRRGRDALGGAELFPGLGAAGSHPPCAPPRCGVGAGGCLWGQPPQKIPVRWGSQPGTDFCGTATLGVALARHRGRCVVGTWHGDRRHGDGGLGPSARLGGWRCSQVVVRKGLTLSPSCQPPPVLSPPGGGPGSPLPGAHRGSSVALPQRAAAVPGHGSIPPSPQHPSSETCSAWIFGVFFAMLKGPACEEGS